MSIHALKLCHDSLEGHITGQGRRSRGGRNNKSCRTSSLHMWPLRSKLGLESLNRTSIYDTNDGVIRRSRNGDRNMVKDPHDSWRKDELITSRYNLIDIKDRSDKVTGKVNRRILKEGQKKTSARLSDRVIVRQWSKSECHHHVKESQTICKARAWGVLFPTPYGRRLTKVRQKLISRHSLKTLTTRVIRMRYTQDM